MMNTSDTVSARFRLSLVVPEHGAVPLVVSFFYSAGDPYAIHMAFQVGADDPVEWIFSRDLLSAGLDQPAGDGDVQMWPGEVHGIGVLNIALSSPSGQGYFEAPMTSITDFLNRTYRVIAAGHESDLIDIDSELDELLRRA